MAWQFKFPTILVSEHSADESATMNLPYQSIRYRTLAGNQLTGTIPVEWSSINALEYMYAKKDNEIIRLSRNPLILRFNQCRDLAVNQLTGSIPAELGSLDSLRNLCVKEPKIT